MEGALQAKVRLPALTLGPEQCVGRYSKAIHAQTDPPKKKSLTSSLGFRVQGLGSSPGSSGQIGEPVQGSGIRVQGLGFRNYLNDRVGRRASVRKGFPAARGAGTCHDRTPPPPHPPSQSFGLRFRVRGWALRLRVRVRGRRLVACGSGFGDHILTPAFAPLHPHSASPPPSPSIPGGRDSHGASDDCANLDAGGGKGSGAALPNPPLC